MASSTHGKYVAQLSITDIEEGENGQIERGSPFYAIHDILNGEVIKEEPTETKPFNEDSEESKLSLIRFEENTNFNILADDSAKPKVDQFNDIFILKHEHEDHCECIDDLWTNNAELKTEDDIDIVYEDVKPEICEEKDYKIWPLHSIEGDETAADMASNNYLANVPKLQGRENYEEWSFAMENFLVLEDLSKCIDGTETENELVAKAKVVLSLNPSLYMHVKEATTAKEKLSRTGLKLDTSLVGSLLLAGLPDRFAPMVMALEHSGTGITTDTIKSNLLDMQLDGGTNSTGGAFAIKVGNQKYKCQNNRNKNDSRNKNKDDIICYRCKQPGHFMSKCPQFNQNKGTNKQTKGAFNVVLLSTNFNNNDWYLDSGASVHLTCRQDWLLNQREPIVKDIMIANNSKITVKSSGEVDILTKISTSRDVHIIEKERNADSVHFFVEENTEENDPNNYQEVYSNEDSSSESPLEQSSGELVFSEGELSDETYVPEDEESLVVPENVRRSQRERKIKNFEDFVTYFTPVKQANYEENPVSVGDPNSVAEALAGPNRNKWISAMRDEMKSFSENRAWDLVDLPEESHWKSAKRILRYLKGMKSLCLEYESDDSELMGFVDSDFPNNTCDRRSYTGFVFKLVGGAVSWECKKQTTVALSSTEAEYMAITEASKEAIHFRNLLSDLLGSSKCITINNDNQSAQKLAMNPVCHKRSKHIDVRYHFIREAISNKLVDLKYLPTDEMPADVLTKALCLPKHSKFTCELGLKNII
ncbi:hypothetical protein JTB14_000012 [Gonioctena quinquepunctata]|nr:hypothetical protein JTB14_000012 [Gonioctena quinquepunctata]